MESPKRLSRVNGKFYARWKDDDGTWRRKCLGTNNIDQAKKKLATFKATGLKRRVGVIYFVRCESADGLIKIGFATNVEARVSDISLLCPYPLTILAITPGTISEEMRLHHRFRDSRVRGEWFRPSPELTKMIAALGPYAPPVKEPFRVIGDLMPPRLDTVLHGT